jgi:pimeloyl-ACP methyl ester carboxylesterase
VSTCRGLRLRTVQANGVEFALLEAGSGPLALCLHGFPDTAYTWQHLMPALASAGFHAVAPFARGYAPTAIPGDGCYTLGALIADAVALHEVLGADEGAVLIGHDWGAETAYGAAAFAPGRWRRVVTLAVPPAALDPALFSDYEQLKRFFYLFAFRDPLVPADTIVARDGMAFIDALWRDWSPGFQPGEHLARVKECLRDPENLAAALGYYRADSAGGEPGSATRYGAEQQAVGRMAPQPTLYLHGSADGCIGVDLVRGAEQLLAPGSHMMVIENAGHFPHLEMPGTVNEHILGWVSG